MVVSRGSKLQRSLVSFIVLKKWEIIYNFRLNIFCSTFNGSIKKYKQNSSFQNQCKGNNQDKQNSLHLTHIRRREKKEAKKNVMDR